MELEPPAALLLAAGAVGASVFEGDLGVQCGIFPGFASA